MPATWSLGSVLGVCARISNRRGGASGSINEKALVDARHWAFSPAFMEPDHILEPLNKTNSLDHAGLSFWFHD
jgi:hypothetical protein